MTYAILEQPIGLKSVNQQNQKQSWAESSRPEWLSSKFRNPGKHD